VVAETASPDELFEKYLDCYTVSETAYHAPADFVNPALIDKTELIQAADSMYYRANGKQYTAFWTPASDEHYGLNEWCGWEDTTCTKRVYHDCTLAKGIYFGLQEDGTYAVAGADYDYFTKIGTNVLVVPEELDGIPVTRIAKSAFSGAKFQWAELKEIVLPDSILRICEDAFDHAFADDDAACKINMPQQIEYLGNGAFSDAMQAFGDTLTLPDSIEYVHWNALQDHDWERRESGDYVKVVIPDHPFLTTDGNIRTLYGVDASVVVGNQMLSIIDAIPYVLQNHADSIQPYIEEPVIVTEPAEPDWVAAKNKPAAKILGDLDENSQVNVLDSVMLARLVGDDAELKISEAGKANADFNADGAVKADDLSDLMKHLAKL